MRPTVSVIIPVYNAAPYLVETLDSVLRSTYRPIEVVMVDDGSSDDSAAIGEQYCAEHSECRLIRQSNAGVSVARNHAIREANGEYILPVDADDKIGETYIEHAVQAIEDKADIRIVGCRARMFGDVEKEWKLPPFSHTLLARKNMIPVTSLFRKADWERAGGFCEKDIYREDWDFWLSLLEQGGTFCRLDEVGLWYRVRKGSRRIDAKQRKRAIVDAINRRHPAYMRRYLGGPLHYHRSWSRAINLLRTERRVGYESAEMDKGLDAEIIYEGRNTLRRYNGLIYKQFAKPNLLRGAIYGMLTKSKARRSYEYGLRLQGLTPMPIAYTEERYCGVLRNSMYICRESECKHTFNELIGSPDFPNRETILRAIGVFTATLHQRGVLHADYSGGNILFNDDGSKVEIIDLNRIHFCKHIRTEQGLKNFERLNIDREALRTMATAYAQAMGIDAEYAAEYVIAHRWYKHIRQGITNL